MDKKESLSGKRKRKYTPEEIEKYWEEYKKYCDNFVTVKTEFSQRISDFVTKTIPSPITYNQVGFSVYLCENAKGMNFRHWEDEYCKDERFADIVTRIKRECEQDVRRKFENGNIPTQLAPLWMSKYGYSTKNEQEIRGSIPVVIAGEDDLED